jgi:truncated hemoglobin YjbI
MPSLHERFGGKASIEAAVVLFYRRAMDDEALAPFFAELDLDTQIAFMTMVFGGLDAARAALCAQPTRAPSRAASTTAASSAR